MTDDEKYTELCCEIEKLPGSEQQTKVITMFGDFWQSIKDKIQGNDDRYFDSFGLASKCALAIPSEVSALLHFINIIDQVPKEHQRAVINFINDYYSEGSKK